MPKCKKCGTKVESDDAFCPECGAKIKKEAPKVEKAKKRVEKPKFVRRIVERPIRVIEKPIKVIEKVVTKKSSGFKTFIKIAIAIIIIIFIFRACTKSEITTQPAEPYQPPSEPEPKPEPPPFVAEEEVEEKLAKEKIKACSGANVKISDACWSCGIVSCGLVVTVENTGSKPIFKFNTKTYINAKDYDESSEWDPLDEGAKGEYYPYTSGTDTRMLEFIPVVLMDGEEFECTSNVAKYGNAYGDEFPECGAGDWRNY